MCHFPIREDCRRTVLFFSLLIEWQPKRFITRNRITSRLPTGFIADMAHSTATPRVPVVLELPDGHEDVMFAVGKFLLIA